MRSMVMDWKVKKGFKRENASGFYDLLGKGSPSSSVTVVG